MIPGLRGVVENVQLRAVAIGRLDDLLQSEIGEFGIRDQLVELVDIGFVMLPVMKMQRRL
jgi:hypothetical protein